jgi:hypothetical protein
MVTLPANDQTNPNQVIPNKPLADLVQDADRLMAAENISGAERILWEAARRFPGEVDIWIVIVGFLLVRHRRAEAVDPARRSILLAPDKDGAVRE